MVKPITAGRPQLGTKMALQIFARAVFSFLFLLFSSLSFLRYIRVTVDRHQAKRSVGII